MILAGEDYPSMNSQTQGKLRPLLVFVALMFVLSEVTEQVCAQRMPEARALSGSIPTLSAVQCNTSYRASR